MASGTTAATSWKFPELTPFLFLSFSVSLFSSLSSFRVVFPLLPSVLPYYISPSPLSSPVLQFRRYSSKSVSRTSPCSWAAWQPWWFWPIVWHSFSLSLSCNYLFLQVITKSHKPKRRSIFIIAKKHVGSKRVSRHDLDYSHYLTFCRIQVFFSH